MDFIEESNIISAQEPNRSLDAEEVDENMAASNNEVADGQNKGVETGRHQCPECGKIFINKSVLNRHMRVHTGEKPYNCPVCNKAFSQLGNMTKHLKSHENAHLRWDRKSCSKPFKCPYPGCTKSFTAKTSLQSHLLSHENAQMMEEESLGSITPSRGQNRSHNPHRAMISSHLRHHHFPSSLIFQEAFPVLLSTGNNLSHAAQDFGNQIPREEQRLPKDDGSSGPASSSSSQCLHNGCNQVFNNQSELREHLYSYTPGLVAEHEFLINTVLQFADMINSWESKSSLEKESLKAYAQSVKVSVEKMRNDLISPTELVNQEKEARSQVEVLDTSSLPRTDRSDATFASKQSTNNQWTMPAPQQMHGNGLIYEPLHNGEYYDQDGDRRQVYSRPSQAGATGAYSVLLDAHNSITDAWGQHHLPTIPHNNHHLTFAPQGEQGHRATMSWEDAIERSQLLLSKGVAHPSIIINPCHTWEPYNFLEIFTDDMYPEGDHDQKRQKVD